MYSMEFILIFISMSCFLFNCFMSFVLNTFINLPIWCVFVHYYVIGMVLIGVHILGHSRYGGWWRKQHVFNHHIRCYPYKKFVRPVPYKNTIPIHKDGNVWMFAIPAIIGCWILTHTYIHFIGLLIYSLVILLREDWLHQMIHTTPHALEDTYIFNTLRILHHRHHIGKMSCNYGFVDPFHDWVLGTLEFKN